MQCFGKCDPGLQQAGKTATLNRLVTFVVGAL